MYKRLKEHNDCHLWLRGRIANNIDILELLSCSTVRNSVTAKSQVWISQMSNATKEPEKIQQSEFCDFAIIWLLSLTQNHFFNVWKGLYLCGFEGNNSSLRLEGPKISPIVNCFFSRLFTILQPPKAYEFCVTMPALFNVKISFKSVKKPVVMQVFRLVKPLRI